MIRRLSALAALLAFAPSAPAQEATSVTVSPAAVTIRHHRHPHSLQVLGRTADGFSLDLHAAATYASADTKVATVDAAGWVRPVANGTTTVTVTAGGKTTAVHITVQLPAAEPATSFRHEVMPVLTRAGCNMGSCHGYSLGKNGFKLSLRGESPEQDFGAVVRDAAGRRISYLSPAESLLLAKGRGDAGHEGGVRFARGSLSDDILTRWVREGTPGDIADAGRVVRVRLVPDVLVMKPGQRHRLQLLADYADGSTRDVTRLGLFAANNDLHAKADEAGVVVGGLPGETAVIGRFERKFAATGVTVLDAAGPFTPTPVPSNLIDRPVLEKLNRLRVAPSGVATDEEFLRRAYLDLIGVQPKPDDIRSFLADRDPRKREKLPDALFARPEFVDHWSLKWGDLLQNSRTTASPAAVYQFREFMRGAVASNTPADEFARRVLTARGGPADDPASGYFAASKDVNDTVERVTQVFCGVRMLCARCHSHPLENWTQADYFGVASFFTQVAVRPDARAPAVPNSKLIALNLNAGSATNPRTGKLQPPRFLGGAEPPLPPGVDRREAYAAWLTSPQNPFFARGLVNRVWSYFFHRGIIDPVDDVRSTNPPINPELLDALTADFVKNKFDLRHLMRTIVGSATYQRSSVPTGSNNHDEQNFSRAVPRRIPAEALLDSLVQATGVAENVGGAPGGFRAAQLPDGDVASEFLRLFGKPQRMDACECERDNGSNMLQALSLLNGKSILGRVRNPAARPALLLREKLTDENLVIELYLWSLARHPSPRELAVGAQFVRSAGALKDQAAQDLMWALLNSRDFLLVH
ncbi:DUF1549 and DUF1553 domain-containing protein [Urbifossiella limnaea]|uniref:Bacterial Ig-like domain (Group 2) n=1 Tax=Urbifossiella limnaea TaxID=2528023 RepID=A0A517XV01_9BACT|nr:DUF1549 and DUF1553 domain-containing protein [Urbifossiella limnaea]QDU21314.1 Bacterial Ig-like domain (group 2) [Urbifossiella limnaea]